MEYLNRIQIRGKVGAVRLSEIHGTKVANFSVRTEHMFEMSNGDVTCETTWHNVVCWQSESAESLDSLAKECSVYVDGRIRMLKYTSSTGGERSFCEILASKLEFVKDE